MSYRIEYGPEIPAPEKKSGGNRGMRFWTAVFLLAFVFLVRQNWPEGTRVLRSFLLPGEPSVTEAALFEMVEALRTGGQAGEALTAFCRQIIHGQAG